MQGLNPMNDISYQIPGMIERVKRRAALCAGVIAGAAALVALGIAI